MLQTKKSMKKFDKEPLENLLVWSSARIRMLQGACPRQYYYTYIGSWEGWSSEAEPECQAAYRLKHLTTPELEIGSIIHRQIKTILETARLGLSISAANEISIAQEHFKMFIEFSKSHDLTTLTAKKRKLLIHELGKSLSADQINDYVERIEIYLTNFFKFADVIDLLANPTMIVPEFLDVPGFEVGYEMGVPARLRTDAVFVTEETFVVADWKSGSEPRSEDRQQALRYDIFIRNKIGLSSSEKLEVRFYYLGSGQVEVFEFNDEERAEMLWLCGESFSDLCRYSDDPRINTAPEERFHPRVTPACLRCNFQQLCPGFLRSQLHGKVSEGV
jgi:hypothetical protein